jgi:quercetin dioxygenase-like cupin family protein
VLEGAISIKFDTGESYELKQGDLFEFKSSVLHTVEALADAKLLLTNASYSN